MRKPAISILIVIIIIITLLLLPVEATCVGDTVIVGGMAFGIKFYTDGVLICGVSEVDTDNGNVSPGEISKLRCGDVILMVNDSCVNSVEDVTKAVKESHGKAITLNIRRSNDIYNISITPLISKSEKEYKLGLWIKDGTAGIGTVTYIDSNTGNFAGLGHGVYDIESGQLMQLREGKVCDVTLSGIKRGEKGDPGELQGFFSNNNTGILLSNTDQGVFGIFTATLPLSDQCAVIASNDEVEEGSATILCTLDDNIISQYDIEIEKINYSSKNTKNFVIKVTDDKLIEKTGGIVQGMSGSPILQNGKLIGAVTHVLVDDPLRGYGIFIENMLSAAENSV